MDGTSGLVILVAEDDYGSFVLLKRSFKKWGFDIPIVHFENGQLLLDFLGEAVRISGFEKIPYLILLDIRMPLMGGLEVLERIRRSNHFRHIPIVMLSGLDNHLTMERCLALGCDGYIVKPLKQEEFISLLARLNIPVPQRK